MKSTDVYEAGELLSKRSDVVEAIMRIEGAKACSISTGKIPNYGPDFIERKKKTNPDWEPEIVYHTAWEGKISAKIREIALSGPREELREIDAKLAAMGVEIVIEGEEQSNEGKAA